MPSFSADQCTQGCEVDNTVTEPVLHNFLATLTRLEVPLDKRKRIGLRYNNTPEVRNLLSKLRCGQQQVHFTEQELSDPNVLIAVLKDVLSQFPGGILNSFSMSTSITEVSRELQFMCVALDSPLDKALQQITNLIESLPYNVRNFAYLMCFSLKNLADQSSGPYTDSYTDLLLLFTPVLFPSSVNNVNMFVQASRVALILIDMCDKVFKPFLSASPLSDSAYFSDEEFIQDDLTCLPCLPSAPEVWFKSEDSSDESASEALSMDLEFAMEEDDEFQETCELPVQKVFDKSPSTNYYRLAFTEKVNDSAVDVFVSLIR